MISYEELTADPERTVRKIVDFAGAFVTDRAIARAVGDVRDRRQSRFNVGVSGRGAKLSPKSCGSWPPCSISIPKRRTIPT